MKKFLSKITFGLLFLWQLPQNILGLFLLLYFWLRKDLEVLTYKDSAWAYRSKYMSGGISLGSFIFLCNYSAKRETTIAHEYGHVKDSKIFGPLYLLIIGLPSILNAWFHFTKCYYSWYPEKRANKHAGLGVDSLCRLYFLDK